MIYEQFPEECLVFFFAVNILYICFYIERGIWCVETCITLQNETKYEKVERWRTFTQKKEVVCSGKFSCMITICFTIIVKKLRILTKPSKIIPRFLRRKLVDKRRDCTNSVAKINGSSPPEWVFYANSLMYSHAFPLDVY